MDTNFVPDAPPVDCDITVHHYNTDKLQALFYGIIMPLKDLYTVGHYYNMINKDAPALTHIACLQRITPFDWFKISKPLAYICEGVDEVTLRHLLINIYGPDVKGQQLALYLFKNWDKFIYQEKILKIFKDDRPKA